MVRYSSWRLKALRTVGQWADAPNGTDEYMVTLIADGAFAKGMNRNQLLALLGEPDKEFASGRGNTDLIWITRELGGHFVWNFFRLDSGGKAIFVPHVRRRYEQGGLRVIDLPRDPTE